MFAGLWKTLFGDPDLGPVDFAGLVRRRTPNDALICPPDVSPQARPDREPPTFPASPQVLRAVLAEVARATPRTMLLEEGAGQSRYLVRSALLQFPDTVNAEVIPRADGRSTIALYSRSQVGRGDLGVNRRRLEDWLARIERQIDSQTDTQSGSKVRGG